MITAWKLMLLMDEDKRLDKVDLTGVTVFSYTRDADRYDQSNNAKRRNEKLTAQNLPTYENIVGVLEPGTPYLVMIGKLPKVDVMPNAIGTKGQKTYYFYELDM